MTLRGLALRSLALSGACALVLVGASTAKLGFYEDLQHQSNRLLREAAKVPPVKVPTEAMSHYRPSSEQSKVLEISRQGRILRVHYFKDRARQIVESLGENTRLVRRDIYYHSRIRVQQFYNQDGALQEVHYLDEAGRLVQRELPRVAPPPPGWVY